MTRIGYGSRPMPPAPRCLHFRLRLLRPALRAVVMIIAAARVDAACLPSSDPAIQQYARQSGVDPAAVVQLVSERLAALPSAEISHRAELYVVLAEAHAGLEHHDEMQAIANEGLASIKDTASAAYINLIVFRAANTFDDAGVQRQLSNVESLRRQSIPGSSTEACLLIALAYLELAAGHPDRANANATRAYHLSRGPDRREQRVMAADVLSVIVRDLRDFEQALKLNREVLDWDVEQGATFNLATTRFIRGTILRDMRDHAGAIVELMAAQEFSRRINDSMGVAYNNLLLCMSHIELGNIDMARDMCEDAEKTFSAQGASEPEKMVLESLALIDVKQGQPMRAMARINRVLDRQGSDLVPRRMARIYEIRARVHAALGEYRQAFEDLDNHMQRYKAAADTDRARDAAAVRVRYETDREIERSAALQRELVVQKERLAARSAQLRWMMIAAMAGVGVVALLTYLLYANRKQKQLLAHIAHYDDLTGLPNRRRTLAVARAEFDSARARCVPLTVGVIDLDHFKQINDRCGHAVGDAVLKEFAHVARRALREGDLIGRWGGEEFLVVLPGATLDVALGVVERVRQMALAIKVEGLAQDMSVSASSGLAATTGECTVLDELLTQADAALYDAKRGGRDLVCVAPESYNVASTGVRRVLKTAGIFMATGKFERLHRA